LNISHTHDRLLVMLMTEVGRFLEVERRKKQED